MSDNKIIIQNLNKSYGKKQVLFDVNLEIERGMFGLLGPNGAGKTTLMKTLATLLNKSSGTINVCGIPVEQAKRVRQITGYLPQEFEMYPGMTVYEAMDYLGVLADMTKDDRMQRIPMLLQQVNLTEQRNKKVKALSGGMKRRLGIAQALLNEPKVLIVDEPTAGLDPEERIRFRNMLCEAAQDRVVILSTHIVGDIEATCESIAVLDRGRLRYSGTVSRMLSQAQGYVYQASVTRQKLSQIKQEYMVTAVVMQGEIAQVRLVSHTPPDIPAKMVEPNVEDAYMLLLHRNSGV